MASKTSDLFGQFECEAIGAGFQGFWDWWRQFKETMPHGDTWHCEACDTWAKEPGRNEQGEPVCEAGHDMSQTPF